MKPRHLLLVGSLAALAVSIVNTSMAFAYDRNNNAFATGMRQDIALQQVAQLQQEPVRRTARQKAQPKPQATRKVSFQRPAANPKPRKKQISSVYLPQTVSYKGKEAPGTIVIDTKNRFLFLVQSGGKAKRYGVGVGKQGFSWKGGQRISRKAEWPTWTPPKRMIERERKKGRILPAQMKGGINNPLGARALYLGNTLYRIHGTNQPWTIGKAMSSGCIRMRNEDVTDLYNRVPVGTRVVVR
ncbi:L,D-transpeptidase [Brucellaceae bacterium D45D]